MSTRVYLIDNKDEFQKAGPTDLIQLLPTEHGNSIFIMKWQLLSLVDDIVRYQSIHLSGPTGSAKTSLIEALSAVKENFEAVCDELKVPVKPLKVYPIEMAVYETPGELFQRRAISNGNTYDEPSHLIQALIDASLNRDNQYSLIWLREMGRVHASSVQGGLLNLMTHDRILLPDGQQIEGYNIAWIADSNYQAGYDAKHTLVKFDDALRRRFGSNLTIDYLTPDLEEIVLTHLITDEFPESAEIELIHQVVKLGRLVRKQRNEGNMQSVVPPTIYGYLAFIRKAINLPSISLQQIARATLLGNASTRDQELIPALLQEVFGLQATEEEQPLTANLF